jgi:hypothetical protein
MKKMKYIVVQELLEGGQYRTALRVVRSNHPRFIDGSRFDYGFMGISIAEGYTITVLPSEEALDPKWKDGELVE